MIKICGVEFESDAQMLDFIADKLYWLKTHNKNYNRDQYFIIEMLFEMVYEYNKEKRNVES